MAKASGRKTATPKPAGTKGKSSTTTIRNTPIPRSAGGKREITQEMIAIRAYEIYASGKGGSESDNWFRAEAELRAGI